MENKEKKIQDFKNMDSKELQIEILLTLRELVDKTEKVRRNTSILVFFIVVLPILVVLFIKINKYGFGV
ncbi:hypothetical protein T190115A13A_270027 [Tenacibaculum sp. 190524A02b]|uniref:Uncharacterized protein n=1 Tax=Tenacibaculum vairaonense TaxID=3137860 RepID=A0ABM9PLT4_9FLAO